MILKSLSILNFKNIKEASLVMSPKINCFVGNNGMGKTNILDAIYYLSSCRSISSLPDSSLITHDADFYMLEAMYEDDEDVVENIHCSLKRGSKKHLKRNQKEYKRLSQHIGLIPVVLVSPSDTSLVDGASELRRRMMDVVISQYNNEYMDALTRYTDALQQRNALLKMEETPELALLEIWEEQMAFEGERIYAMRKDFVERLTPIFQSVHRQISSEGEDAELHYISHCQRGPLLDVIQRDRMKDLAVGYSLHGVHRDDLEMLIDGYPLRREGSQGQLKSFVIALKLAQFDFLRNTMSKTTPLLLLDDIFDKLDANRVEQIVNLVSSDDFGQIFITDTNRDHIDSILSTSNLEYKLFLVEDGNITIHS